MSFLASACCFLQTKNVKARKKKYTRKKTIVKIAEFYCKFSNIATPTISAIRAETASPVACLQVSPREGHNKNRNGFSRSDFYYTIAFLHPPQRLRKTAVIRPSFFCV